MVWSQKESQRQEAAGRELAKLYICGRFDSARCYGAVTYRQRQSGGAGRQKHSGHVLIA